MPRPMKNTKNEKAKDFKGAITRLFKELKIYKVLILTAVILSLLGTILSIIAPNKLSDLVDEISQGLVINSKNLKTIGIKINENISKIDIDKIEINNLEKNEKTKIFKIFTTIDSKNMIDFASMLLELEPTTLEKIIPSIEVQNKKINAEEQLKYIELFSTMNKDSQPTEIYSKIDEMPENIKELVQPKINMQNIKNISMFLLILYILSATFTFIEALSMTNVSNKFAKRLRSNISKKINKLPLNYFDKNQAGDILSRVTNDVDTIAQNMSQSLADLVSAIALFIGTIIMMFVTNYIMAITAILSSIIGFLFMTKVLSKSQKYHNQRQKYLGEINGHIEEVYSGFKVVKAYNAKEQVNEKFDEINENLYNANRKGQFLSSLMMPMMGFVGNFGYVAVCIVGALLVMNGNITFGVIVAFITYVRLFTSPLTQIGQSMNSLQLTAASSERVFEFLDEQEMSNQKEIKTKLEKKDAKGNIEFENVEFTYEGNKTPTIKNFSAKIKAGQKIAIVGPTGAGKTTMVNLLMKFYEINKGDIKIDGISIKNLKRENIHSLFTMVLQDTWLFEGTIKENIIYNRKNIKDEKVKEVCKIVGLDHFIKTLSHGYDTKLSDNDNVSAGQRQLLTIARGMIEDAPFLILDEATSNVDTRTEELVQKAMDKLTQNRTSFIIAHRLSTIKNADLILVMKDGNIIEQGNHKELMKKQGFYADLYNSQFEL